MPRLRLNKGRPPGRFLACKSLAGSEACQHTSGGVRASVARKLRLDNSARVMVESQHDQPLKLRPPFHTQREVEVQTRSGCWEDTHRGGGCPTERVESLQRVDLQGEGLVRADTSGQGQAVRCLRGRTDRMARSGCHLGSRPLCRGALLLHGQAGPEWSS